MNDRKPERKVALFARIPEPLHHWFKVEAAKRGVTLWKLVEEALESYREANGRKGRFTK